MVKNLPVNSGDTGVAGSVPGLERFPGVRNGNPLQYSCLESLMDRGTWWATVRGSKKSQMGQIMYAIISKLRSKRISSDVLYFK